MKQATPTVIVDTSVLVFADQLQLMRHLEQLYGRLIVPETVHQEIDIGRRRGLPGPHLVQFDWIEVRAAMPEPPEVTRLGLGPGESSVLSLAFSLKPGPVSVLLDDRDARGAAASLGIDCAGILGVLVEAKRVGLVAQVKPYLEKLVASGFWVTPHVVEAILRRAGESA